MVALLAIPGLGCGNNGDKGTTAVDDEVDNAAAGSEPSDQASAKERKASGRKKKGPRRQEAHIGEIPKDAWPEVWLKDPLAVAAEKGQSGGTVIPSAGAADASAAQAIPSESAGQSAQPAVTGGSGTKPGVAEWTAIISGDVLADESKSIKKTLNEGLANKGRYDSTYKELRVNAAVLSALARVASEHPDAPSWKTNAKYIRDAASQVASESQANGEKFYKPARAAYDKLDALLSGSKPPDVAESADMVPFSEVAKRNYLMLRMQRAYDWMKANVNTEAIFKKETAKVGHESAIIALLSKIISSPGYDSADDPDYLKLADVVTNASLDVETAVRDQDFKAFTTALDKCYKGCTECHSNFKNN